MTYSLEDRIQRIHECVEISEETVDYKLDKCVIPHAVKFANLVNELGLELEAINPSGFGAIMFEFQRNGYVCVEVYEEDEITFFERNGKDVLAFIDDNCLKDTIKEFIL